MEKYPQVRINTTATTIYIFIIPEAMKKGTIDSKKQELYRLLAQVTNHSLN